MPVKQSFLIPNRHFLLPVLALLLWGCSHHSRLVYPSVYFWQTEFNLNTDSQQQLIDRGIKKIYARFFDVDWNKQQMTIHPISDIRFVVAPDTNLNLIPVVFIRNRVFENTANDSISALAHHIINRIDSIVTVSHLKASNELQIDCDWTKGTANRYFTFLDSIHVICKQRHWLLSATIRLHQVKFARLTGVPPVDRGMLMFYNMGKAELQVKANSIYDYRTAKSYLNNFNIYPLKLDVALPLFSWVIVYRHGKTIDILENIDCQEINGSKDFLKKDDNNYIAQKDIYLYSKQIFAGDQLKFESISADDCLLAARQIDPFIKTDTLSICLFDFKQRNFFKHDSTLIAKVFNTYR